MVLRILFRHGAGVNLKLVNGFLRHGDKSCCVRVVAFYAQEATNSERTSGLQATPINGRFRYMINFVKKKYPRVETITTSTLNDWLNNGKADEGHRKPEKLVLFDVRLPAEYNVSRISPSAIYLDPECRDMDHVKSLILKQIADDKSDSTPDETPVTAIMYCAVGYRASIMASRFQTAIENPKDSDKFAPNLKVYNLEGSILKWSIENRPLVDSNNHTTEYVHPFSRLWGLVMGIERTKWKF